MKEKPTEISENTEYFDKIEAARIRLCRNDLIGSVTVLEEAIVLAPDLPDAYRQMWDTFWFAGDIEQAHGVCEQLRQLTAPPPDTELLMIRCLIQLTEFQQAAVLLEKYRMAHPEDEEAVFLAGILSMEMGDWAAAEAYFKTAGEKTDFGAEHQADLTRRIRNLQRRIALLPGPALQRMVLRGFRKLAERNQDIDLRIICTRLIIRCFPNEALNYYHLGQMLTWTSTFHNSNWEAADRCYRQALRMNKDDDSAAYYKALTHYNQGQYHMAVQWFRTIPKDSEWYRDSLIYRGNSDVIAGNLAEAAAAYNLYLEMDPHDWRILLNLAMVQYRMNAFEPALALCRRALKIDSENVLLIYIEAVLAAGVVNGEVDREEARKLFERHREMHGWSKGVFSKTPLPVSADRENFQRVPCPVCESETPVPVYDNGWIVAKCSECGLLHINPQPTPDFLYSQYNAADIQHNPLRKFFRQLLTHLINMPDRYTARWMVEDGLLGRSDRVDFLKFEAFLKQPRMIDLGASVGWQSYSFQVRGWEAVGLEISREDVAFGKRMGVNMVEGTVETMHRPETSCDLVTMTHAIEHFTDPLSVLKKIARILKPGGLLMMTTPCAETLPYYFCGPEWLIHGEHVLYFSRENLVQLVEKAGLTVLDTVTYSGAPTMETYHPQWASYRFNTLVTEFLDRHDQGDIVIVYATRGDPGPLRKQQP